MSSLIAKTVINSKLVCLVFSIIFALDYLRLSAIQQKMAADENKVDKIVKKFNMSPHPEGGFYKRIFESSTTIHTPFGKRQSYTSLVLKTFEKRCSPKPFGQTNVSSSKKLEN